MKDSIDKLVEVGRIGGKLEILSELDVWIKEKMLATQQQHEQLGREVNPSEYDTGTASTATH